MADLRLSLPILVGIGVAGALAVVVPRLMKPEAVVQAAPAAAPAPAPLPELVASDWCGEGTKALPSDVCYIDGRGAEERRTLVIWLHGVIGKNTTWSHDHVKMLTRMSKSTNIEMLFPKGVLGEQAYAWPGTAEAQAENEEGLIKQWMTAKDILEKKDGKPFTETFIFGFSSGAYFAGSLAMRGRVDVDGYAVFGGGQAMPASPTPVTHFAPVFVGVNADDSTGTAAHGRAFAGALAAAGIPRMVTEENIGHDLSPTQFTGALAFLRKSKR